MFSTKKLLSISKGFTLIELLVVIAIIGLLSAFLVANFVGVRQRARDTQRKSDLRQIQAALELYRSDIGSYPASLPACGGSLVSGSSTYMKIVPCDPLGGAYTYSQSTSTYSVIACLENSNDSQKDGTNVAPCTTMTSRYSYTLTNP